MDLTYEQLQEWSSKDLIEKILELQSELEDQEDYITELQSQIAF